MTDVTEVQPVEAPKVETTEAKAEEPTPQQQAQMMEMEVMRRKFMLSLDCLHLAGLAINTLPLQEDEAKDAKGKKNPSKRVLTLADLDKVSAIVERFTHAAASLAPSMGPRMPMGMPRP